MVKINKLDAEFKTSDDPKIMRKLDLKMLELNEKTDLGMKIFGEQSFIDKEMVKIAYSRDIAMSNAICESILNVGVEVDKKRLEKWLNLCVKLETIDEQDLVNIATHKKFMELHHEINKLKTEVERHKQALYLVCQEAHDNQIRAEERKKVVQEIKKVLDNKASYSTDADDDWLIQIKESSLYELLDQIERGE